MKTVSVAGIWIRRRGLNVELLAEYNGEWLLCATENIDSAFSNIVEPNGVASAPRDPGGRTFAQQLAERD